jgi:hypothetical protein
MGLSYIFVKVIRRIVVVVIVEPLHVSSESKSSSAKTHSSRSTLPSPRSCFEHLPPSHAGPDPAAGGTRQTHEVIGQAGTNMICAFPACQSTVTSGPEQEARSLET